MANDRKWGIPMEVIESDGTVTNDCDKVLYKWKHDYHNIYNPEPLNSDFNDEHLNMVKDAILNPDSDIFPKLDCSTLNGPITRVLKVKRSVYRLNYEKPQE